MKLRGGNEPTGQMDRVTEVSEIANGPSHKPRQVEPERDTSSTFYY